MNRVQNSKISEFQCFVSKTKLCLATINIQCFNVPHRAGVTLKP